MPAIAQTKKTYRSKAAGDRDYYEIDGVPMVRVTRVLGVMASLALERWKINQNREQVIDVACDVYDAFRKTEPADRSSVGFRAVILDWLGDARRDEQKASRAADKGKLVHSYIQTLLNRELGAIEPLPDIAPELLAGVEQWKQWREAVGMKPRFVEFTVHHPDYGYAGTTDCVGEIGGQLWIMDWKTTTGIYPNHKVQIASYAKAYQAMGHEGVVGGRCILIPTPKEGKSMPAFADVVADNGEIEELWSVFRACLHIYKWQNSTGGK